jgi:hypothetical protein
MRDATAASEQGAESPDWAVGGHWFGIKLVMDTANSREDHQYQDDLVREEPCTNDLARYFRA